MHTRIAAVPSHSESISPPLPPLRALLRQTPTLLALLATNGLVIIAASAFLYLSSPARLSARFPDFTTSTESLSAAPVAGTKHARQPNPLVSWADRYSDGT